MQFLGKLPLEVQEEWLEIEATIFSGSLGHYMTLTQINTESLGPETFRDLCDVSLLWSAWATMK